MGHAIAAAVVCAVLAKVSAWAFYGPVTFNDTALYEAFAAMLRQDDWSWQYEFFGDAVPVTGLRTIGYPAILALAQTLAGEAWRHAVVALQIALSVVSVAVATGWIARLTGSPGRALFGGLCLALGQAALYDTALLPDSLFSSIAIIILCTLASAKRERPFSNPIAVALLCGLGAASMTLLRANGLHIAVLFLPLAAVWVFRTPSGRLLRAAALVLPVVVTVQGYVYWNQMRTGERFLSTGAQFAAFQPLFEIARDGTNVFTDDSVLSRTVRETTAGFDYADIDTLNRRLAVEHGWTSIDIADAGTAAFVDAVLSEPLAMLQNAGRAFGFSIVRSLFNPALAFSETHHLITQERLFPGTSKILKSIGSQSLGAILYLIAVSIGTVISTIIFAAFLVGTPLKCMKPEHAPHRLPLLALWAGTIAMFAYYSLIHLEYRYILLSIPVLVGLGLWSLPRRRPQGLSFKRGQ